MAEITQNIKLYQVDSGPEWLRYKSGLTGYAYTFQVNPNKLDITNEVQVVESQFLRQDGGIIRPTQVKLRKISGSGKFFDIPWGAEDQYPLVSKNAPMLAFDAYKDLVTFMNTRSTMRMSHEYLGEIYVIIQALSLSNTPSPNSIDFSFSFIETMLDSGNSGFERKQQVPGMAVSSRTSQTDTVQYDTYTVVSGDTLSKISLKFYGTASKWGIINDANTNILTLGPNVLKVGWVLKIPKSTSISYKRVVSSGKSKTKEEIMTDWVKGNTSAILQGICTDAKTQEIIDKTLGSGGYAMVGGKLKMYSTNPNWVDKILQMSTK